MATVETADVPGITRPMTYDEYLASPEEMARYDILDGWKVYRRYGTEQLANPTILHQQVQGNLYVAFRAFAQTQGSIRAIMAPCDVQVETTPRLKSRQPDLLLISNKRLGERSLNSPAPLSPAPELVVEILSPSDTQAVLAAKLADYRSVDVQEAWIVRTEESTVQVVRLSAEVAETIGMYHMGDTAASVAFPNLAVTVESIFSL